MKKTLALLSFFFLNVILFAQNGREIKFQTWALTPPMGWNSWDCFGPSVKEAEVKANADYMAANLKQFGWQYIVVDIRWYVDNQTTGTYNAYSNSTFIYDQYGRYMPSPTRFPSAANGAGFKPLADYIHGKGLKFGIHIMRGVPKVAVDNRLPILNGNGKTAADIYSTDTLCTWLGDNYTIKANKAGAQEYYNSIFALYASWGVDFIKIDDLSRPYHQGEIDLIRKAIDNCGRPIVLSMSPGETPVEKFDHVKSHANMWRTVDDFWDNWSQLNYQFQVCNKWAPYISPGNWPDADMLPLGHIAIRGERGVDRQTNFTANEQYTLMTLWSVFKSPLMFGGHLPDNSAFTTSLITNPEVLAVHRSSVNNRQLYNQNDQIAWTADDPFTGDKFLALFNNGGDGFVKTNKLLYRSGTISRLTDGYGVNIDMALPEGIKQLYMIVNDGGDGFTNDHADWINPTVYKANGDSVKLTTLTWEMASAGWGTITKNKSISGGTLNVKGVTYANGIGTHSKSVIMFPIPDGCVRFKSFAGLDLGGTSQSGGATVEFMVSTEDPTVRNVDITKTVANSGRISRTYQRAGKTISADITGATKLYLVVTDAGDNYNYDHGDWINPTIYKENGDSLRLTTLTPVSATSGWDVVHTNKSLNNGTLTVNGKTYTNGYGVNSYSTIVFNLPAEYTRFSSFVGFDDEVLAAANGVTMEFLVYTQDPSNNTKTPMAVDLPALGFNGNCLVRDLWAKKDSGTFSGTQFVPAIGNHGAGFYRISALNRPNRAQAAISASMVQASGDDTVTFDLSVQKTGNAGAMPTGSFVVYRNDTVVGILPVDNAGRGVFTARNLPYGLYTFKVHYSGDTNYTPQDGNSVQVEVRAISASVPENSSASVRLQKISSGFVLKGLNPGDSVMVFDALGKKLYSATAHSESMPLKNNNGVAVIKVKTAGRLVVFKSVLK